MQTVAETSIFQKQAAKLFSDDEKAAIIEFLASNPLIGDLIQGTGGVRKVRVPANGKGKSGGARVIYYVLDPNAPIFALLVYGKNEKSDLSPKDKRIVKSLSLSVKESYRSKE